ncbi:MAG TPA: cupin domain-containing protein [Thermoanaerobaculia bacterium]|jgi:anti-sigma factor ChrR (cupin superfamily)
MSDALSYEELALLDRLTADEIEPVAPPTSVRARILEAVRSTPQLDAHVPGAHESRTVRADEGEWSELAPGVRTKKLSKDVRRGTRTLLIELAPFALLPAHDHAGNEESYVVRGSCNIGAVSLYAGDYHHVDAGSHHGDVVASAEGCLLLLTVDVAA